MSRFPLPYLAGLLPLAAFSFTGCTATYPGETVVARSWVLPGVSPAGKHKPISPGTHMPAPPAEGEFVTAAVPKREFPESKIASLRSKSDLGLAFSGGGNRAAVCALGQVRALTEIGVMNRARYISAVSGGSWFCVPYTFFKGDTKAFLGPYIQPEQLSWNTLTTKPDNGSFAACASNAPTPVLLSILSFHGDENFAHRLNEIYLSPFGKLGDEHRFFCHDDETRIAISKRNQGRLGENDFNVAAPNRPYLIASSVLVAHGFTPSTRFVPVEMTSNYTGAGAFRKRGLVNPPIGGGYVESFGYDSKLIGAKQEGDGWESKVDIPKRHGLAYRSSPRFALADVMAASGSAPSVPLPELSYLAGFPEFLHWSPATQPDAKNKEMIHTDGGGIDNAGIIPLLRREVGTIIAFINTRVHVKDGEPQFPSYIAALFGGRQGATKSRLCQVFGEDEYRNLRQAFLKEWEKNAPLIVHRQKPYTTVQNEAYGVRGGHKVRVIWVFLGGPKELVAEGQPRKGSLPAWLRDLDKGSKDQILSKSPNEFSDFPYFRTFFENGGSVIDLSAAQVNALSQFTSYSVMENKGIFEKAAPK